MITVSRKEIEDAIDTLYIETFSGEPYIAGTRKILALLDKAEVVHGEAVAQVATALAMAMAMARALALALAMAMALALAN